ncbi:MULTISPECIES: GNAT family N-acetyltransferase [Clostridium]|uniref:GNAT family N-acetyltransferase n=1 Tax=Clostridium TaxID=1485 RepID=UPI001899C2AB|nr:MULTISPECIES: GNAT family N-acetyltransferase [Clostridium]MDI9215392.1 GNAT family N-acetyltransferase [Clostridium tertium]
MEWKIKKFEDLSTKELYSILALRNKVFVIEQECIYQDCDYKDLEAYHLFCTDDNSTVAYLRILKKGVSYDEVSIGRVVVDEKYRGRDLGRKAMKKALEFINNTYGESPIRISAQVYIKDFYKSLGFIEVSNAYLEDDIPHIEMLRNIKYNN